MNQSASAAGNAALWLGLQQAVAKGLVRSIGVSNYSPYELDALPGPTVPAVNQCEMSVEGADNATIAYCAAKGIRYQSYGAVRGCPFNASVVTAAAAAHGVSAAQVCLRWTIDKGAIAAASVGTNASTIPVYAKENLAVESFALTVEEISALDKLQL
jgi:2,5-diketo-D-gluconate reductase A